MTQASGKAGKNRAAPATKTDRAQTTNPKFKTKTALVCELLTRREGASLKELCTLTGWQAHTARAVLSRLRSGGHVIDRTKDKAGTTTYRMVKTGEGSQ